MPLWKKMLWGIFAGLAVGWLLSPEGGGLLDAELAAGLIPWIAFPGGLFMALINMIVIPLVITSVTLAVVSGHDVAHLRKTGIGVGLYFVMTTIFAVAVGIFIATTIQPGQYIAQDLLVDAEKAAQSLGDLPVMEERAPLPQMVLGIFPTNPAKAVVEKAMLQIVVGSILLGVALLSIGAAKAEPVTAVLRSVQAVTMRFVDWAMAIAPYAVFSFLCVLTMQLGMDTLKAMSAYMGAVLLGLLALLVFYMTLVAAVGRRDPFLFLRHIRNAQLLAFSSSSSAATMPLTLRTAEEKLKLRPEIFGFVIPLGTTINMDGTAIYQIIAALFLAQIFGVDLTMAETVVLAMTIVGASIGSPGTPGVGLVILATILTSIGITPEGVALILAVDRLLDMCRTAINVTGDLTASVVMNRLIKP
ncbi:MAG: dicarboxylate/amino acid:cation symporter [Micavibrio sp.]|nr:MAG: dicarboxylate/amino acid:cation symporter [Micavibrio sp.]